MAKVALLAVLTFSVACKAPEFPGQRPDQPYPSINGQGFRQEDADIYDAVLPDYPVNMKILDREMRLLAYTNSRLDPIEPKPDRWRAPSGAQLPRLVVPGAMLRDFNDRNRHHFALDGYRPRQLQLKRTNKQQIPLLSLTLPGYSPNHDAAIVEISVWTSGLSGGGELLYLKKIAGQWRVVGKQMTWIS